MSTLYSDSDIEEIVPQPPVPRPRTIRRPVPVRTKSSSASGLGSSGAAGGYSDDSDDGDFFRWRRRPAAPPAAEGVGGTAGPPSESAREEEAAAAAAPAVECVSDASSSDGEGAVFDDTGSRKKLKHLDDGNEHADESGSEAKQVRSRSVSLTPPPFRGPPATTNDMQDGLEATYVRDSDDEAAADRVWPGARRHNTDISSLDPALQAVLMSSDAGAGPERNDGLQVRAAPSTPVGPRLHTGGTLEKVQVEFQFVFDDEFLGVELPHFWEAKRWRRIKIHERDKVTKKLSEQIAVILFTSDTMDKALRAYAAAFSVDVLAMDPVLMNRTIRVFPTSTLASLGDKLAYYITVFPRSVFNRVREREALEQARETEQSRRDFEAMRQLQLTAVAPGSPGEDSAELYGAEDGGAGGVAESGTRLKIRDKSGKDVLLRVAATTSVAAIIENYCKLRGLPGGTQVRLEFDDEPLHPSATIGDTEIEDDDMLTAFF